MKSSAKRIAPINLSPTTLVVRRGSRFSSTRIENNGITGALLSYAAIAGLAGTLASALYAYGALLTSPIAEVCGTVYAALS